MAYVIIGATGALGRALAEKLAARGTRLILVARDETSLAGLADELDAAGGPRPDVVAADVTAGGDYLALLRDLAAQAGGIEALLLPIGHSIRDTVDTPAGDIQEIIATNLTAPITAVAGLYGDLRARRGVVVGFGSIAAIRGRRRNIAYGASKRGLAAYFEGLALTARETGVAAQFYVLGFLDTEKLAGERTPLPKGDVETLAERVLAALPSGASFTHWYPVWWRPLAVILRLLPRSIYGRVAAPPSG